MNNLEYRSLWQIFYQHALPGNLMRAWKRKAHDISYEQTVSMPRIPTTEDLLPVRLELQSRAPIGALYRDDNRSWCLRLINDGKPTIALAHEAVTAFHNASLALPTEILLCPHRYFSLKFSHYYPSHSDPIPYRVGMDSAIPFDVLVRSAYIT